MSKQGESTVTDWSQITNCDDLQEETRNKLYLIVIVMFWDTREHVFFSSGIMAQRINEADRRKRRGYQAPPERPLGGDVSPSDSDRVDSDDDDDDDYDCDDRRPLLT